MAKKKKKKGDKLPYVHIDVLPEDDRPDAEAPDERPEDREDEIIPFVIPVFRKTDIPQNGQGGQQGLQPGFGNMQYPPVGQGMNPQQDLAQIQNNLLMQHNMAQQQAGSTGPMGGNSSDSRNGRQPGQGFPARQSPSNTQPMGQQHSPRQGNPRQSMQQQAPRQAASRTGQPQGPRSANGMQGGAARPSQGAQATSYRNGPQGQGRAFVQQGQPTGAQPVQRPSQSTQQAQGPAGNGRMRQPTGQFAPVGAQAAQNITQHQGSASVRPQGNGMAAQNVTPSRNGMPSQNGTALRNGMANGNGMPAQAAPSPSSAGTMQSVAAAAAARAEQARMHSAFGGMHPKAAPQQTPYAQGPRQQVQQAAASQSQQAMGVVRQATQAQSSAPRQVHPGSSGPFAPVAVQPAQGAPHAQPAPSASQAQAASSVDQKPASTPASGNVGDPLLDAKAIEESPMFDKPPVSIEEGMRKSTSGRKVRRRVIVIILIVLLLAGGGTVAYVLLSQQGVVPQISIETKTVPVTPQGSSSQAASSSSSSAGSEGAASAPAGTGSGDLSGTVVYQYSANTASGVEYKVEETVSFQANGDCQSSTMNMTFPDAASAKTFTDNLARDYGSSFKLDSLNGENAVVTIDNSGLHLSRDEYENALRYSVTDLVVLGK